MTSEKIKNILEKISIETSPDFNAIKETFDKIKKILEPTIKSINIDCDIFLGGSAKKETMLKYSKELDIFIRFNKNLKSEDLSNHLEKILKNSKLKYERIHGSRDFFRFKFEAFEIEIIPIFKIKKCEEAENITDISPLHVEWVSKNIQNLTSDVRIAKMFCKAQNIYGAESYINGFSGYVLEILIIYYNGFENLLKNASKWNEQTIIDPKKYYKNEAEINNNLNKSKISPLIIIDPTQKERNASAALSIESYNKFIFYSKEFIENPSIEAFKHKIIDKDYIQKFAKKLDVNCINIKINKKNSNKDIVGTKIKKLKDYLEQELSNIGYDIYFSYSDLENIWILYIPEKLPKFNLRKGPKVTSGKNYIDQFKKKYLDVFIKDEFIYAFSKNKSTNIEENIKNILKNYEFKNIEIYEILKIN